MSRDSFFTGRDEFQAEGAKKRKVLADTVVRGFAVRFISPTGSAYYEGFGYVWNVQIQQKLNVIVVHENVYYAYITFHKYSTTDFTPLCPGA